MDVALALMAGVKSHFPATERDCTDMLYVF